MTYYFKNQKTREAINTNFLKCRKSNKLFFFQAYKPQKKKKDPNAPKQPLSAYFLFSQEERLKVKGEHPAYSICEVAKELGKRWADMAPEVKQRYQQMAEEGRQKYDQDMAAYRQGNYTAGADNAASSPPPSAAATVATTTTASVRNTYINTAFPH